MRLAILGGFFMTNNFYKTSMAANQTNSTLAVTILRDALIPELTGEATGILYWVGKRLARQFALAKDEDLPLFFEQTNWGTLKRIKGKANQQVFTLTGEMVATRLKLNDQADFKLECGFLAETVQNQSGFMAEALVDSVNSKKGIVTIIVQVDTKDPLDFELYEQPETLELVIPKKEATE